MTNKQILATVLDDLFPVAKSGDEMVNAATKRHQVATELEELRRLYQSLPQAHRDVIRQELLAISNQR